MVGALEPSAAEVGGVRAFWGLCAEVYSVGSHFERFCSRSLPAVARWLATLGRAYKLGRTSQLHKYYSIYKHMIFFLVQKVPELPWVLQRNGTNRIDDRELDYKEMAHSAVKDEKSQEV